MRAFTIRKALKSDFVSWAEMRTSLWSSHSKNEHLSELEDSFGKDSFEAWIALDGEKYIGFAEASVRPFANGCESRPVVFFEGVWVNESYRKSGVGRDFVKAIEGWAKSQGIKEIGSDAELSNSLSHACHQKWGFEETERVIYYRKKLV